jgi:hypothetical protein
MRYCSIRSLTLLFLVVLLAAPADSRAEMAGSAGRATPYGGTLDLKDGSRCDLSIQVERVSFLLTSFGKYRLVRMLVDCRKQAGLMLSSSADRLELALDDKVTVPAVLSLQRSDSALWDALDVGMRQTLAYPPFIKAGEPVYLFAYFPVDQVRTMPRAFSFTIASLGQTVMLQNAATAARR